jgi:CcmD family protein
MDFGLAYLGVGYALAFLGVIAYVLSISRRQRALEKRVEELDQKK